VDAEAEWPHRSERAPLDPLLHPVEAYVLVPARPAPDGIPREVVLAAHCGTPDGSTYAARRAAYLDHVRRSPTRPHLSAIFQELARLAAGGPAHVGLFEAALDYVDRRIDCSDFVLHGVLRLVLQFGEDPRLPSGLLERARRSILAFKYWPDEPGRDSLCSWTENHQILFASAALLAGEAFPDAVFESSGETGRRKAEVARARVLRWLEMRFRTGFSEWLSHVYYDEDLTAALSLVDFAAEPGLRGRAAQIADLLLLDMALHHFSGVFASSHGRSYERSKKRAAEEGTADTARLAFGTGSFAQVENMSAACLALSPRYRIPAVLAAIAAESGRERSTVRQCMGIRIEELSRWGLDPARDEDMMEILGLEGYAHPRTIEGFVRLLGRFGWWENAFFAPFAARRTLIERLARLRLLPLLARAFESDLTRNLRPEVNLVSYRTPDYQLSSALDWRPGMGGDQQHLWQATLGPDAVCFTTHPGPRRARSPGHWTGSASLPRVGQVANVAIVLYAIPRRPALHVPNRKLYTHAWLPRDRFDEVTERGGWFFARRGEGYLALRSQRPARWQADPARGEDQGRELVAEGADNVWLCELGRRADDGSFADFAGRIAAAPLVFGRRRVRYASPSQGSIELGWKGPLIHEGREVAMRDFPRYETPWGSAPFPMDSLELHCGGHWLRLGRDPFAREASEWLR
jgi:hypothetical protein